jgi:hypothetical protein
MSSRSRALLALLALVCVTVWLAHPADTDARPESAAAAITSHAIVPATPVARSEASGQSGARALLGVAVLLAALALAGGAVLGGRLDEPSIGGRRRARGAPDRSRAPPLVPVV